MIFRSLIFFSLFYSSLFATDPLKFTEQDQVITQYVTRLMSRYHYSHKKLEDKMAKQILDTYIKNLDPGKRFFTQKDIKQLSLYRNLVDDMLFDGDLDFAMKIYKRYITRLEERVHYIEKRITQPFDFQKDDTYVFDREKSEWAKDQKALDQIWDQMIKNEILISEFDKLQAKKEKAAGSKKNDAIPAPSNANEPPQQTFLKRYKRFLRFTKEDDHQNVLEFVLNAMTRTFDPHSAYHGAKTMEEWQIQMNLKLTGIGAQLQSEKGYTKITKIIPGGPAHRDKRLQPGDLIYAVAQGNKNPIDVVEMRLSKVVSYIRGVKGSIVKLYILRGGKNGSRQMIQLTRDVVELKESEAKGEIKKVRDSKGKTKRIGVINLPSFYADFTALQAGDPNAKSSTKDVARILKGQIKKGIDALVIDVRNNGGGSLTEAILLSGLFINKGPIVQTRDTNGNLEVRDDHPRGTLYDGPLIVMTNHYSASASEIFAAAIQDYGRGIIVGDQDTHGKGTVQQLFDLSRLQAFSEGDETPGQLKYTMAKFYRVTGASTQKKGVSPDIVFPSTSGIITNGEKSLDHVLAWDEIAKLKFKQKNIKRHISTLKNSSLKRRSKSQDFLTLNKLIQELRELTEKSQVTLKREKRLKELTELKAAEERRTELGKKLFGDLENEEENKKIYSDIYLKETLKIASDYTKLSQK